MMQSYMDDTIYCCSGFGIYKATSTALAICRLSIENPLYPLHSSNI